MHEIRTVAVIALSIWCVALDGCGATFANEVASACLDADDALEVRKLWNIAADSSNEIRKKTADWLPETKSYFRTTFDWRHCLPEKQKVRSQSFGNSIALMDPGLEPTHPKHSESTNQFNPSATYRRSTPGPADVSAHGRIALPKLLLQFAENFRNCKNSFMNVMAFKAKSNQLTSDGPIDHLTASQKVREAEDLHRSLKTSIQIFADLAGEEATTELIKDLEAGKK